jgi:hypothetical protein
MSSKKYIHGCAVTTTEIEKMVISEWKKMSDHDRNMERLSHMCNESHLKRIGRNTNGNKLRH